MLTHRKTATGAYKHFTPYLHRPLSCIRIFTHGGKAQTVRIPMSCIVPSANPSSFSPTSTLVISVRIDNHSLFIHVSSHRHSTFLNSPSPLYTTWEFPLASSRAWVTKPWPSRLYHPARDHICINCVYRTL